jgi:tetratricopeptide (TPR) repeat protein
MGRDEWYRNLDWDSDIEEAFRTKLSRARGQKPQYIMIQAGHLAESHPIVALSLIDEYFETGDAFFTSDVHCIEAVAYRALGRTQDALSALKNALDWEASHSGHTTTARIEFPKLVVQERLVAEYNYALEILTSRFSPSDHSFPNMRYAWNGCCAIIAFEKGEVGEAQQFAERALRAAAETESPFRYHRSVGVVKDASDEFGRRIKSIARPSFLRSLFRIISLAR